MAEEFKLIFHMNHLHLSMDEYNNILDEDETHDPVMDFTFQGMDVQPEADPSLANSMRKQRRAQALIEGRRAGMPFNDKYIAQLFLESIDEPRPEEAMRQEPPPPSPEQVDMEKFKAQHQLEMARFQLDVKRFQHDATLALAKAMESMAKAQALGGEQELEQMKAALALMVERTKAETHVVKSQADQQKAAMGMVAQEQKHQHEMQKPNPNVPGATGPSRTAPGGS